MFITKKKQYLLSIVLSCILLGVPAVAHMVGVSPGKMEVSGVVNNLSIERSVRVTRPDTEGSLFFQVTVTGDGADYVELPESQFLIEDGKSFGTFQFNIAPETAANGTYKARLNFAGIEDPTSGSGAATKVQSGATMLLSFVVTDDEIESFRVTQAFFEETEVEMPVTVLFEIENKGNVDARPNSIEIIVYDKFFKNEVGRAIIQKESIERVSALDTAFVSAITTDISLPAASYEATVRFLDRSRETITFFENLALKVHPAGTLDQSAELLSFEASTQEVGIGKAIKFTGNAKNTGAVSSKSHLSIDIFQDGELVESISSDEKLLQKNGTAVFELTYHPSLEGAFTATAKLGFGPRYTESKSVTFNVKGSVGADFGGSSLLLLAGVVVGSLIVLLLAVIILLLVRNGKKK